MTRSHGVVAVIAAVVGAAATFGAHQLNQHPALQKLVDQEAIFIRKLGFSCGVERWSVKTLADSAASSVQFGTVKATNVPALDALPSDQPSSREAPTETTVWGLNGVHIVAFKEEPDSDIHLKLQSILAGNPTMIAEIPDMSCVTANSNPQVAAQQQRIGQARQAFLNYALSKGLTLTGSYQTVNWAVRLTGVGFFDFKHGQNGVAPNAIELHPVLSFKGLTP